MSAYTRLLIAGLAMYVTGLFVAAADLSTWWSIAVNFAVGFAWSAFCFREARR